MHLRLETNTLWRTRPERRSRICRMLEASEASADVDRLTKLTKLKATRAGVINSQSVSKFDNFTHNSLIASYAHNCQDETLNPYNASGQQHRCSFASPLHVRSVLFSELQPKYYLQRAMSTARAEWQRLRAGFARTHAIRRVLQYSGQLQSLYEARHASTCRNSYRPDKLYYPFRADNVSNHVHVAEPQRHHRASVCLRPLAVRPFPVYRRR